MRVRWLMAATLLSCGWPGAQAVAQEPAVVRHLLALDLQRLAPFRRAYDILVYHGDSATTLGERTLSLQRWETGRDTGWVLVEERTGVVPAVESLYLAPDVRPVRWVSLVGPARLAAVFVGDTIMGATTVAGSRQNLVIAGRPDLLVSGAMTELLLGLLPLTGFWRDSAAALVLGVTSAAIVPVELLELGTELVAIDSVSPRPAHVVALRADERSVLYWVDLESGGVVRMQQTLPAHTGTLLEYRLRAAEAPPASP